MAKAIEIVTGVEFQSPLDDDEVKTTWILKSLSNSDFLDCVKLGEVDHVGFVHKGLTGWKNFVTESGEEIEFCEDMISQIPPTILLDVSLKIQAISSLNENERKNSE